MTITMHSLTVAENEIEIIRQARAELKARYTARDNSRVAAAAAKQVVLSFTSLVRA